MSALLILLYIALGVAWLFAWAEIFVKAGYNRWLCFTMIVPVVNLVVFLWFAFSKWPVYEFVENGYHIKRLKSQQERIERQILSLSEREGNSDLAKPSELSKLTREEKEKKLAKIREQLERDVEERKQQKERKTLKHTPGKCPYCGSSSVSENIVDGPLSGSKMKTFGYYYKWDCQCVDCRAKWFGIE